MSNHNHTRKNPKPKNENRIEDQRWKLKGGPHKNKKKPEPDVCPVCWGDPVVMEECENCQKTGEVD